VDFPINHGDFHSYVKLPEGINHDFPISISIGISGVVQRLHHPWKLAAFSRRCLDRGIAVVVVGSSGALLV
jgi:hypothetical protein